MNPQKEEFLLRIFDSITDSLLVIDPRNCSIVLANDPFLVRVGLTAPAVMGKPCYEVMYGRLEPCQEEGFYCPMQETARLRRSVVSDKNYLDDQGQEHTLQVTTYPHFDSQGGVDLVTRLERDVTERRKMEEALAFRSRELQRTQHQLETLFEISRQVSSNNSLGELIDSLQD